MLRRAIPASIGLRKTTRLVVCLCRLHNFCINERLGLADDNTEETIAESVPAATANDALEIAAHGGISVRRVTVAGGQDEYVPDDLLGGGHHHNDTTSVQRRIFARSGLGRRQTQLPRERLLAVVDSGGFHRPKPQSKK